jgi:hypothetical protein
MGIAIVNISYSLEEKIIMITAFLWRLTTLYSDWHKIIMKPYHPNPSIVLYSAASLSQPVATRDDLEDTLDLS